MNKSRKFRVLAMSLAGILFSTYGVQDPRECVKRPADPKSPPEEPPQPPQLPDSFLVGNPYVSSFYVSPTSDDKGRGDAGLNTYLKS